MRGGGLANSAARSLGIDLRSLALFRIALGLVILLDLALRAPDFAALYLDGGVLLRESVPQHFATSYSVYLLVDHATAHVVFFAATVVAALTFTVGVWARTAAVLLWFLLVSLDARNPLVLSNGDILRNLCLLWSALLPVSARLAVDARCDDAADERLRVCSVASAGLLIQIALVLAATGVSKLSSTAWTSDAVALEYALQMRGTSLGHWLLQLPESLLDSATRGALAYEVLATPLLFCPMRAIRLIGVSMGIALMLAIAATVNVGPLPLLTAAGLLAFLPSSVWCTRGDGDFDSTTARAHEATKASFTPSDWLLGAFSSWVLASSIAFAVSQLPQVDGPMPVFLSRAAHALGLQQGWQMFVALPQRIYWLDVRGTLPDGSVVDPRVSRTRAASTDSDDPPARARSVYRWVRFEESLLGPGDPLLRERYVAFLCERWGETEHVASQLVQVSLRAAWVEPLRLGLSGRGGEVPLGEYACAD